MRKKVLLTMLGCLGVQAGASASGFALIEQNVSGLGNAFAGQAASAQDASTVFFNPAGMLRIEGSQVVMAGHTVQTSSKLTNNGSTLGVLGSGGDAGGISFLPNFYYVGDLGSGLKWGVGVSAPFGLKTEYNTPWAGQTQGVLSELKTINVNPSLAWLVNDKISVGVGINYQRAEATLSSSISAPAVNVLKLNADDDAWGYNLGVLFKLDNYSRLGVAYRSSLKYKLTGKASGPINGPIAAKLNTPDSASISLFNRLGEHWDLLTDLTWTGWSNYDKLTVTGTVNTTVPENWNDTLRFSVGANYRASDDKSNKWLWRAGLAYDQAGTPDAERRTVRLPDTDRIWLALGGQYKLSDKGLIDFGFAHLFMNDASINHVEGPIRVKGTYASHVNIVSAQYTHNF